MTEPVCLHCNKELPCLHRVPIFQNLDAIQIQEVQSLIQQKTLEKGEVLFREGDSSDHLVIIRSGSLKLIRYGSDAQEFLIETLFPGDFYGGDNLFAQSHCRENGIAGEELGVCLIASEKIRTLMLSNPQIGLKVMTYLNAKLDEYRLQVEILSTKDVEKRIAMFLLERLRKTGGKVLFLSQEDIGNSIHLTKETVNRKLSVLQEQDLLVISGKKKIEVLDHLGLQTIAES